MAIVPTRYARSATTRACPAAAAAGPAAACLARPRRAALHGGVCCRQGGFVQHAGLEHILQQACGICLVDIKALALSGGPAGSAGSRGGCGLLGGRAWRQMLPQRTCSARLLLESGVPFAQAPASTAAGGCMGQGGRRNLRGSKQQVESRRSTQPPSPCRPPHLAAPRRAKSRGPGRSQRCMARGGRGAWCSVLLARTRLGAAPRL